MFVSPTLLAQRRGFLSKNEGEQGLRSHPAFTGRLRQLIRLLWPQTTTLLSVTIKEVALPQRAVGCEPMQPAGTCAFAAPPNGDRLTVGPATLLIAHLAFWVMGNAFILYDRSLYGNSYFLFPKIQNTY